MPRAIWKGSLGFGLVQIPVTLHSAEQRRELSFSLLDKRDLAPIGYQRINKRTDEVVPWEEVVKGYEYEDDHYVVLGEEDFRRANVKATQTVDILAFVNVAEIEPLYYERPYYLAPTRQGQKAYGILREALHRTSKVGVASVVIRTRQHLAAVLVRHRALVLDLLRFPYELRSDEDLDLPDANLRALGASERELAMAIQLIEGMSDKFDPRQYHDRYHDDLLAFIQQKVKRGQVHEIAAPAKSRPEARVVDLMSMLKKSLAKVPAGAPRKARSRSTARTSSGSRRAARPRKRSAR